MLPVTLVVPVGDEDVFRDCLLSSRLVEDTGACELIAQRGWSTAAKAFNDAIDRAHNDLIVCLHQDVLLPDEWHERFVSAITQLEMQQGPIGVAGCAGITSHGKTAGHMYRHDREFHPPVALPAAVETLDEMLICFRKSSGLRFDENLPSFFGYAVDLCLEASRRGLKNYAIDAPCFHQAKSRQGRLPEQFFINWNYLCDKWKDQLPVQTLTGTLQNKRSFTTHKFVESIKEKIGYAPEPWWADLPKIDTAAALRGSRAVEAADVKI